MGYLKAALGGTFDRLHKGHEYLIDSALAHAQRIMIGLTTDEFVQHKEWAELIEPLELRRHNLMGYLSKIQAQDRAEIELLTDVYGTTTKDQDIDVLVVTKQTQTGAEMINIKRSEMGWPVLPVVLAEMIKDAEGNYISSTRIRAGHISRSGKIYQRLFDENLTINPTQRGLIQQLVMPIKQEQDIDKEQLSKKPLIALVGDGVTATFLKHGWSFDIAVIDGRQERQSIKLNWQASSLVYRLSANNPVGTISHQAAAAIKAIIANGSGVVTVNGEEDLLGFPVALGLPLGSVMYYGQPGVGMVEMIITEAIKERLATLLDTHFFNNGR